MKKAAAIASVLAVLFSVSAFAGKPSVQIPFITGAMTIDGSLADWKACGIKPIAIDTKAQVAIGVPYWLGAEKQSAEVYVAFSSTTLYVAAKVMSVKGLKNNKTDGNIYDGNAIELFIGFDNSDPGRELYTETDYQFGFSTGDYSKANKKYAVKPSVYCFNMTKPVAGAKIVSKPIEGGYIIEASIPASFLAGWDVKDGGEIGFDIGIDDIGDKGLARKVQMTWTGDKDGYKIPKGWGKASFKATACK
jgi:hypothetical protein